MNPMVVKILLLGDKGVGKSSIKGFFTGTHSSSITQGLAYADIGSKTINTENESLKLQLWDVDADIDKIINSDTNIFIGVHGIVLIFDVSNIHSLDYIKNKIYPKISSLLDLRSIPIIIVGNKTDLRSEFEVGAMHVSYEMAMDTCNELSQKGLIFLRIPYFEGSIEDPTSYDIIFQFITTKLLGMFS